MNIDNKTTYKLFSILSKPYLSVRDTLTVCRRLARELQAIHVGAREQYLCEIKAAEAGLPFTEAKVQKLKEGDKEFHLSYEARISSIGNWLVDMGPSLDQELGFDSICDLLNVNPVHRHMLKEDQAEGADTLISIAHFAGLEDSAEQISGKKKREYKDGPLFWCYMEVMCDYIKKNPGSFFGAMSKPGGPLHGLPVYRVRNDGAMTIQRPSLAVHSSTGKVEIVERKPELIS